MSGKSDVELGKASIDTANGYVSRRTQKPVPDATHSESPEYESSDSEDELPITANRHARWWYSIFHNITAMIGAGVLGLPQAFKYLGISIHHTFGTWLQRRRLTNIVAQDGQREP